MFRSGVCRSIAVLLVWIAGTLHMDAEAGQGRRIALVIGNSSYKESPLANPANDARDIGGKLRKLGFEVIERVDASQKEMNRAITEFGDRLNADTVALFYYAGHGVQVRGKNYLIPVDAQISGESSVRAESVDVDTVLDQLAGSDLNIVILDACRNNPFERRFRSMSGGLAQMDAPKGSLIAYATAPGKTAIDGTGRNGLYTQELLKQLDIVGQPVEAVFKNVRRAVARATSDQQVPWESSSLTGDFYFNTGALPAPKLAAQPVSPGGADPASSASTSAAAPAQFSAEDELWRAAISAASADAYQTYLSEYPTGRYASAAKIKLASIGAPPVVGPRPSGSPAPENKVPASVMPPEVAPARREEAAPSSSDSPVVPTPNKPEPASIANGRATVESTQPKVEPLPEPKSTAAITPSLAETPGALVAAEKTKAAPPVQTAATLGERLVTGNFTVDPASNAVTGKVLVRWRQGGSFEGELVADKRTGPGVLVNRQGSRIEATWVEDRISGPGTMVFSNGDRYRGEFKNDDAEGKGIYTSANGDIYEGGFRAGERHGKGRITWANGNYWEGQFVAGRQVFRGTMAIKAGDQLLSGEFEMDSVTGRVSGRGSTVWANGDRYEGDFVAGIKQGQGVFSWANGERFEGEWRDDRPNGQGRALFANGERYEGEVKDGIPHGKGTYFWPSGGYFTGTWVAGKKHGKGHLSLTGSSLIEVEYRDDEPVETPGAASRRGG